MLKFDCKKEKNYGKGRTKAADRLLKLPFYQYTLSLGPQMIGQQQIIIGLMLPYDLKMLHHCKYIIDKC